MQDKNAGFSLRLFSSILDTLITLAVYLLPYFISSFFVSPNLILTIVLYVYIIMLIPVVNIFYTTVFTSKFGGTLGKLLFGLKVQDNSGQFLNYKTAFYRNILGYSFSSQFFGAGFWRIIWNPNKLAWHDELFDTRVVIKGNVVGGVISSILLLLAIVALVAISMANYSKFF